MAETSFPIAGGGSVTDFAYERLMFTVLGNGRITGSVPSAGDLSNPILYADSTGRQAKIRANTAALIRGFRWESGTEGVVQPLDANTSGQPRLDRFVLRLDRSNFTVRVAVLKGTPAPTPSLATLTQQTGSTGFYEWPLGSVKVASNAGSGLPSIAAGDVTSEEYFLAPRTTVGHRFPPASPGAIHHDGERMYRGVGGLWVPIGESGPWTKITASGGWTNDNIYCKRTNGFTTFQCQVQLNSTAARAANTPTRVCFLPAEFRPTAGATALVAWMSPGQVGRVQVTASTGEVEVTDFPQTFPVGGTLVIQGHSWPAN